MMSLYGSSIASYKWSNIGLMYFVDLVIYILYASFQVSVQKILKIISEFEYKYFGYLGFR
jgi:hypothetical protein